MRLLESAIAANLLLAAMPAGAGVVAHYNMEADSDGFITETISGEKFAVQGNFAPENVPGAVGDALRFDGYTSRIKASVGDILPAGTGAMTVSLWVAVPCYPIIQLDTDTQEKTAIVSCLDEDKKTGFGFFLGFNGHWRFSTYVSGWPVDIEINTPLPVNTWNHLVAVIDTSARTVKVYNNGIEAGSGKANGTLSMTAAPLYMGQSNRSRMMGPYELMSFNGLIDDITIWDEARPIAELAAMKPEHPANLDIPASRFASDRLRPRFHGMPAAGWTNECHGMYHSDGRYHLFFQKNADGPYMARLHWGHISSANLYDWREEPIAIAPGDWYDIKGCWSGCVFADEAITGGKPNILYTAVDYVKAMIAQASPQSDALIDWTKNAANPIIGGRPAGLSDDFRDPYFFRNGNDAYLIVGSSKNGVGTTTLHRYEASGRWSNSGQTFFTGGTAASDGTFWEMPNVTPMPDGKWLFTATPLHTAQGVRTLYWTGSINPDGTFKADAASASPRMVELNSRHGFGMLSPTVYNHNGKTIALGIVPDKLPAADNWRLGWAHCYSLPREWSLSADGTLLQKPCSEMAGMRSATSFSRSDFDLDGVLDLSPVSGRAAEISAVFVADNSEFGFNIFKSGSSKATVSYNPATGILTADFSAIPRLVNDAGVYDGIYRCTLPERPAAGSEMKINIFIDHSILDIFVNDKWATSIRVFPTAADADGIEAFASSPVKVKELKAWILDPSLGGAGIGSISDTGRRDSYGVYDLQGVKLMDAVSKEHAASVLPAGTYIVGNEKIVVK